MLQITIPESEFFDESRGEFVHIKTTQLQLEHSLISISKWEAKWEKAFLGKNEKTIEETIDYIKCMTITPNVDPNVYLGITNENIAQISKYIEAPMTAVKFFDDKRRGGGSRDTVTSELIYYWLIALNIPFECQKWHLNRLLTLIKVCNIKNSPKKMSRSEIMARNRELNASRRQALQTKG